ncbi:MAG: hypothetical protein QOD53_234, partial [Thermoleophilaceae bacterium]|nr:hypothetical protein [Thermoleophilaceae bacterium]
VAGVQVVGSVSGNHTGTLKAHSDGNGASFLPDKPFTEGEQVSVSAAVPLTGAVGGKVTFTIAKLLHPTPPDPPPAVDPAGHPKDEQHFRSRKDLRPPRVKVLKRTSGSFAGQTFLGPKAGPGQDGNEIVDSKGRTQYFQPVPNTTSSIDFRVQQYQGKPVLTYWQGVVGFGKGYGFGLILNQNYKRIAKVAAGNGYKVDLHEFAITNRGTALFNVYQPVQYELGSVGSHNGRAFDSILQEVDIKTGLVMYEWHSLGSVALNESFVPGAALKPGAVYDYMHINSAQLLANGDYLISGRNTAAIYELDQHTGAIHWRLGGKKSDYAMGAGTQFLGQHDARRQSDGTISLFDNGFIAPAPAPSHQSRGLVLKVDDAAKTASLVHAYPHPTPIHAQSQGSNQKLPNGNFLVGWGGASPFTTEYNAAGDVVWEGQFRPQGDDSYRAYRLSWTGMPSRKPDIAAVRGKSKTTVYASWNGATQVAKWQVLAGNSRKSLKVVRRSRWKNFETKIGAGKAPRYVQVQALDKSGNVLRSSKVRKPKHAK